MIKHEEKIILESSQWISSFCSNLSPLYAVNLDHDLCFKWIIPINYWVFRNLSAFLHLKPIYFVWNDHLQRRFKLCWVFKGFRNWNCRINLGKLEVQPYNMILEYFMHMKYFRVVVIKIDGVFCEMIALQA